MQEERSADTCASGRAPRSGWLQDLYEQFAPVRQEAEQYSEDEINAAIDAAVTAVRAKHA